MIVNLKIGSRRQLCFIFVLLYLSPFTFSIVWRADASSTSFEISDSNYPAVFPVNTNGNCAGTLIDSTHALTAAHCFDNSALPAPFTVTINGGTYTVSKVLRNNCWSETASEPNGADMAVLVLSTAVSGVTAYSTYTSSDEVGQTLTLIGWGDYGPSGSVPSACTSLTGGCTQLRSGTNIFTSTGENTLKYILDDPAATSSTATTLEAISWSGDSGGPAFLTVSGTTYLAGLNSGGKCCDYGNEDEYVRLSTTWAQDWITSTISNDVAATSSCSDFTYTSSSSSSGMKGWVIA